MREVLSSPAKAERQGANGLDQGRMQAQSRAGTCMPAGSSFWICALCAYCCYHACKVLCFQLKRIPVISNVGSEYIPAASWSLFWSFRGIREPRSALTFHVVVCVIPARCIIYIKFKSMDTMKKWASVEIYYIVGVAKTKSSSLFLLWHATAACMHKFNFQRVCTEVWEIIKFHDTANVCVWVGQSLSERERDDKARAVDRQRGRQCVGHAWARAQYSSSGVFL